MNHCKDQREHLAFRASVWTPFDRVIKIIFAISAALLCLIVVAESPEWVPVQLFLAVGAVATITALTYLYRWAYIAIKYRHTPGNYGKVSGYFGACSKGSGAVWNGVGVLFIATVYLGFIVYIIWTSMKVL